MLARSRRGRDGRGRPRRLIAALVAGALAWPATDASAQGLFDFLFGPRRPATPGSFDPSAPPGGRSGAYCVRLCDGRYFPLQSAGGTPEQMCSALCPASPSKVFWGGEITHAVARDGTRYATLPNAFVYRNRMVDHCTCNGRDAFGLAPIDPRNDPTLRPGDVVAQPQRR